MIDLMQVMPTWGWGCLLFLIVWLIVVGIIYSVVVMSSWANDDAPSPKDESLWQ